MYHSDSQPEDGNETSGKVSSWRSYFARPADAGHGAGRDSRGQSRTRSPSRNRGMSHSRNNSQEHIRISAADVEKDLLGLRAQILDNVRVWYSLKHPGKAFEFAIVTCSHNRPQGNGKDLFSAMIVATSISDTGVREIHSKHDVRKKDSITEEVSRTRIEALEKLLNDLEWRMELCMHQYDTKLKRAPRADRKPWT